MTSIDFTILGTTAGIPTKYRNHASIYLTYVSEQRDSMLFDCGEGTQRQMMMASLNFMRVDRVFITHWHADHYAGLLGLMETISLENRKKPLKIYGPEAKKFVKALLSTGYGGRRFPIKAENVSHKKKSSVVEEDEWEVKAMPVKHGVPAVAYKFQEKDRMKVDIEKAKKEGLPKKSPFYKRLKDKGKAEYKGKEYALEDLSVKEKGKKWVYSGDTEPVKRMVKFAKGADMLIHDCTFFEEFKDRKHAEFDEVLEIGKDAGVKKLILTHFSRRYVDVKELKKKIEKRKNVILAKDLLRMKI